MSHRLRPISYENTDVFLIVVDLNEVSEWWRVSGMWIPEIRHYSGKSVPIILVGLDDDCESEDTEEHANFKLFETQMVVDCVSVDAVLRCSATTNELLDSVLQEIAVASISKARSEMLRNKKCMII